MSRDRAHSSPALASSAALLDRTQPPAVGEAKAFHFPAVEHATTPGGLEILAIRRADAPLVTLRYVNLAGAMHDPPARNGLASFAGSLLDEGTKHRSAVAIADQVEGLGGYLAASADWDSCSVSAGALSEHLPFCLDLVAEVASEPAFDAGETARIKALRLAELQRLLADPATLAGRAFARALYRGHVYAASLVGTPETIAPLDRSDCEAFWELHRTQRGSFVVAAGDLDPAELRARVEAAFSGLALATPPPQPELRHAGPRTTEVHVVDLPNAAQVELRMGHVGVPRRHPDRPTLLLLNSILGGKFTSRINLNLRERHGFTYGASSRFIDRIGPGPFLISAAVDTAVAGRAVEETLGELRRLQDEAPAVSELEDSRSYLLGVFPYTLQTHDGLVARLEELAVYGLPYDYFATLPQRLREVTIADVEAAAARHLAPDRLVIAAAGPASKLVQQLEQFGPVEVHPPGL